MLLLAEGEILQLPTPSPSRPPNPTPREVAWPIMGALEQVLAIGVVAVLLAEAAGQVCSPVRVSHGGGTTLMAGRLPGNILQLLGEPSAGREVLAELCSGRPSWKLCPPPG